ncbi:hypothetical protein DL770_010536 [Monosporascus sp. CRB-9-2]|nr:hypothetical protein DL770_010536 [Monosporascus sp. CRB-9-2]
MTDNHTLSLTESGGTPPNEKANLQEEKNGLLSKLGDPDLGKSEEERAEIDRKLVRKVDLWLIPWLSLIYLMSFLDRTNVGNARLAGMEESLGMTGNDYNVSLSVFFVGYALAEPITNACLKRTTPRIFFTVIVFLWGLVMTLTGLCKSYSGLLAARWFLGMTEAGLYPGVNYYLSCWYKSSEIGLRSALFFSAAALAGSFGGLLAAAIALMDGVSGLPGWAWIFILEGLATIVVGFFCWWMIFDWPENARFLSPDDRIRLQRRLILDKQGKTAEEFDKRHIYAALTDWKTYGYMFIFGGCLCPLYAFSLFLPTILGGMGYSGTKAQLFSVPPYAAGAIVTVIVGWYSDKTKWRGYCNIATVLVGTVGFIMLIATDDAGVQYAGTFLGAMGIYPTVSNTLSWVVNNTEGSLKRAFAIGMIVGWGNLNGVVSSNIYLRGEKPRYWTGHGIVLGYQVVCLLGGSIFMHVMLRLENNRRAAGRMNAKWEAKTEEEKYFSGDKRPDFHYTL